MLVERNMPHLWRYLVGLLAIIAAVPVAAEPAVSVVRSTDGTDLLVAQEGDPNAPGFLMIHGFAQSLLSFRRQFGSNLAKRFHLVSFDLRGHGGSAKPSDTASYTEVARSADDVAAVIKATGLHRPVIVAWSYGGIVVVDYVRKYGAGGISGVVFAGTLGGLVKPVATSPPAKPSELGMRLGAASNDARSFNLARNIVGGAIISDAYATREMSAEDRQILFATEMMLPSYVRRAMTGRPYDNSDLIPSFSAIPTLFVRGETDLGMGEPELALLGTKLRRMSLSRYPKTGHLTFFEAPERFNAELAAFATASFARTTDPAASLPRPTLPISAAEHRAFREREFAARDTNKNGRHDPEELRVTSGGTMTKEELARAIRVNCGVNLPSCPLDQFRLQGDAEFRRVDRNGDGIVTLDELRAAGGSFHTENP